jgi:hypothetical protein
MKMYVLLQGLETSNTLSVHGTYTDKADAQAAVDRVRGSGFTAHREARYFIQEVDAEEIAKPEPAKPVAPPQGPVITPHPATSFSESGEELNSPGKPQLTSTRKPEEEEAEKEDADVKPTHGTVVKKGRH